MPRAVLSNRQRRQLRKSIPKSRTPGINDFWSHPRRPNRAQASVRIAKRGPFGPDPLDWQRGQHLIYPGALSPANRDPEARQESGTK